MTIEGSHSLGSSVHRSTLERLLHHPYSLYFSCCFSGDAALQRFLPALCGKHSLRSQPHAGDSAPTSPAGAAGFEICTAFPPILSPALSCQPALHLPALGLQHCLWSPGICFQHTPSVLCRPLPVTRIRSFLCFT